MSRSTIWANSRSRTSQGRCAPTTFGLLSRPGVKPSSRPMRLRAPVLALPDKPSIAVMPFANLSGDPEQEYLADGMVEEIITGLSRIKWLFVIARNSSFAYRGRASTSARSDASSVCAMFSKAACAVVATGFG